MGRCRGLRQGRRRTAISKATTRSSCPAALANAAPKARSRPRNSPANASMPYLGICLGMQMAVIEAARNVCRHQKAGSEEFDHEAGEKRFEPVVYHLKEWVQGNAKVAAQGRQTTRAAPCAWAPMTRSLAEGSKVAEVYGATAIDERHRHRYEVDIKYREKLEEPAGWKFSGMSPDGRLPEIVEWAGPPLVHRRPVPPRAEIETLRSAPAVQGFRPRRRREFPARLRLSRQGVSKPLANAISKSRESRFQAAFPVTNPEPADPPGPANNRPSSAPRRRVLPC